GADRRRRAAASAERVAAAFARSTRGARAFAAARTGAGAGSGPIAMADRERPYLFYDVAVSICSRCFRKVEGKLVIQDGQVFMLKRCPAHGFERVLIASDAEYYRRSREAYLKKPEQPNRFNTEIRWGCPYD